MYIIGIDFGGTIGKINDDYDPMIFTIIKMFVQKYSSQNIFIVSKAKNKMMNEILDWLNKFHFFEITSFDKDNVIFVENNEDKRNIIIEKKINIFIDDNYKVIKTLYDIETIDFLIWFGNQEKNQINLIPKKYRYKITIGDQWGRIWNYKWNLNKKNM